MRFKKQIWLLPVIFILIFTGCRDKAYDTVEKAPASFQAVIEKGLTDNLLLRNCFTVPSKSYPDSYYVAGEIYGGKMSGDVVGVWILDDYENPSNVLSVDQTAIAFSVFSASKHDKPEASINNRKEARIVKKYVERKYYKE